jgi:predicted ABC-type transport system involved in lysophospholipase L1 biosynthesis ATPase subunit
VGSPELSPPLLSLASTWLSFPRGRSHRLQVLADVSLELYAGEVLAVLAQRAQGKSSLLRVASATQRPDRGRVLFRGRDVWELSDRGRSRLLRDEIALVERSAPQLDVPVLTGVALPLLSAHGRRGAYERARRALTDLGVGECARTHWSDLADWERALVALAGAVAREPKLLLVDDLAATLGLGERDELAGRLRGLAGEQGMAVLSCSGDAGLTSGSDRVASLADGSLVAPPPSPQVERDNVIDFPGERPHQASS